MAKKSKKNIVKVDMSDVEARFLPAEDDYRVKAVEVTREEGNEHDYLRWKLEMTKGEYKGKHIFENTSLAPAALFRLRGLLEAAGFEVPNSEVEIDIDAICDEMGEFMVSVFHDEYEPGKTSAKISDYFPVKGKDDDDDDDDDKKSKKSKKSKDDDDDDDDDKKSKKSKDDDDDDDDEEPDFSDMDEDELSAFVDEHDLDVDLDDFKKLKAKREAVKDAYEESKSDDDDDDKKKGGKKKKKKYSAEDIDGMGTAALAEVNDDEELEVELKGTTKAKRRAIKKALKEAGKLEE